MKKWKSYRIYLISILVLYSIVCTARAQEPEPNEEGFIFKCDLIGMTFDLPQEYSMKKCWSVSASDFTIASVTANHGNCSSTAVTLDNIINNSLSGIYVPNYDNTMAFNDALQRQQNVKTTLIGKYKWWNRIYHYGDVFNVAFPCAKILNMEVYINNNYKFTVKFPY